jgi:hypothetical protein
MIDRKRVLDKLKKSKLENDREIKNLRVQEKDLREKLGLDRK